MRPIGGIKVKISVTLVSYCFENFTPKNMCMETMCVIFNILKDPISKSSSFHLN